MDEDPDIAELRGYWEELQNKSNIAQENFSSKLVKVCEKYTMTEISLLLQVKRPTLYYHRDKHGRDSDE